MFVKLNVDRSPLGNPEPLGGGGIICNHFGEALHAFSSLYGHCTNMEAEAKALLDGIKLCVTLSLCRVLVELDSQSSALGTFSCNASVEN